MQCLSNFLPGHGNQIQRDVIGKEVTSNPAEKFLSNIVEDGLQRNEEYGKDLKQQPQLKVGLPTQDPHNSHKPSGLQQQGNVRSDVWLTDNRTMRSSI